MPVVSVKAEGTAKNIDPCFDNFCEVFAPAQSGTHYNGRKTFGHSLIISPDGAIIKELKKKEGVITALIDPSKSKKLRTIIPSLKGD